MLKFSHLLYKKFSFVYHYGNRTYKVFTPKGKAFKVAEINGNRGALETEFWRDWVIEVTPRLFYLEMMRGEAVRWDGRQKAEQFIESKLQKALSYPRSQVHEAYDFPYLRGLEKYGLDANLLDHAEDMLKSVYLPVTSAHGDLHIGNLVFVDKEIKIIDWSMFTSKGSFVTDYIHFYNYQSAETRRESWTKSIVKEQQYLHALAQMFDSTPNQLRLAYTLSRISGATSQRENFSQIPQKEIAKYNYVLNNIINEPTEAPVQRSNTSI